MSNKDVRNKSASLSFARIFCSNLTLLHAENMALSKRVCIQMH